MPFARKVSLQQAKERVSDPAKLDALFGGTIVRDTEDFLDRARTGESIGEKQEKSHISKWGRSGKPFGPNPQDQYSDGKDAQLLRDAVLRTGRVSFSKTDIRALRQHLCSRLVARPEAALQSELYFRLEKKRLFCEPLYQIMYVVISAL